MTPRLRRILRTSTIVIGALLAASLVIFGALLFNFYNETRDPPGPRTCECDLLKQWAATLPLTPNGDRLELSDIRVSEDHGGFSIGGSGLEGVTVDRDAILDILTSHSLNHRTDTDQPDRWNTIFFPGADSRSAPWSFDVTTGETGVGIGLWVPIDGSPWGLETNQDVHELYVEDREAAIAAQEERQHQAIETLQPLQQALQAMATTDSG
jgi:hypothetical protein